MTGDFFVGRAEEVKQLENLLAGVADGIGGAVLVEGEQGIGKTTLLRRVFGAAQGAGCMLAWAAADELGQQFPLSLMRECLRGAGELADRDGEHLGSEGQSHAQRMARELVTALAGHVPPGDPVKAGIEQLLAQVDYLCAKSPVVMVAEDLQWADEASLLMWRWLAKATSQVPLLLAGSVRPGPMNDELEQLRRGLAARGGPILSLAPLADQHASELVRQLAGGRPGRRLVAFIGRAGGNPLYARELVDALVRDGQLRVSAGVAELAGPERTAVPGPLAEVIGSRISALSPETAGVLRWAAVLGQEFTVTELSVVTSRSAGQLISPVEQAVAAGVIEEAAGSAAAEATPRLAFRHGLIRQTLYDEMPEGLRAALHLQAALALATEGAPPERVAAQLVFAPETAEVWMLDWLADAAPELTYRAPAVAADLLGRALNNLPHGDKRRETLAAALVTAAFLLERDEEVQRIGTRLIAEARDPDRAAETAWRVGYALGRKGRHDEALPAIEMSLARPGIGPVWTARLRALRATSMAFSGRPDTVEAATEALALAEAADDRFAAGYALYVLSLVDIYLGKHAASLGHIERALDLIGDEPQTTHVRLLLLQFRAQALELLDRLDEADTSIREGLALAERAGTPGVTIRNVGAEIYFKAGQWDDALAVLEHAVVMVGPSHSPTQMHGLMALIAGHRDDGEKARLHLAAVQDHELRGIARLASAQFLLLARALAAEQAGRIDEAIAALAMSLDRAVARNIVYRFLLLPALARLALASGDAAMAAAAAQVAVREAERVPVPVKSAAATVCQGLVSGDPKPLLAVAEYYLSATRPLEGAQALEDAAELLAGSGDFPAARQAFRQSVELYRGLGALWDIRRAARRLHPHGIRPSVRAGRAATGWEALTPTEAKVAYEVARGLSNPEIAVELWLSRHTVQTHISHILAKLGARSRIEIVREAIRHQVAAADNATLVP